MSEKGLRLSDEDMNVIVSGLRKLDVIHAGLSKTDLRGLRDTVIDMKGRGYFDREVEGVLLFNGYSLESISKELSRYRAGVRLLSGIGDKSLRDSILRGRVKGRILGKTELMEMLSSFIDDEEVGMGYRLGASDQLSKLGGYYDRTVDSNVRVVLVREDAVDNKNELEKLEGGDVGKGGGLNEGGKYLEYEEVVED